MKKLLILLFVVPILFISCSGEDGTDGIDGTNGINGVNGADGTDGVDGTDGTDGEDGTDNIGKVFQVEIDFDALNNFETVVKFPEDIEVNENHVLVVFMVKNELIQAKSSTIPPEPIDPPLPPLWEVVPTIMYLESESLLYSFKYIPGHIVFFLDGTVNLNELPSELTQDISFRVAVLPVDIVSSVDENNLENIIGSMNNSEIIFLK